MKIVLAIAFFFTFSAVAASPKTGELVRQRPTKTAMLYTTLRGEEGKFFVTTFAKVRGQMQNRVSEKIFSTWSEAEAEFNVQTAMFEAPQVSAVSAVTDVPGANLWVATNAWDLSWETKYSQWLDETGTADFLANHGIATDCADVAYAYRWIFARINGLPAANHLAGTKDLFTNGSVKKEWALLPKDPEWHKDQRFMAALNYLLENTYTHTLMGDVYPVAIDRQFISGGAIHMVLLDPGTGHTEPFSRVVLDPKSPSPIQVMASTTPREVRQLSVYGFQFWGGDLVDKSHMFSRFLWAEQSGDIWKIVDRTKMPGFSLEQFDPHFKDNYADEGEAIIRRLMPDWAPDPQGSMRELVHQLLLKLRVRRQIVEDGFKYCSTHNDCVPGKAGWESWSTPTRDAAIGRLFTAIEQLSNDSACDSQCTDEYNKHESDKIADVDGSEVLVRDAQSAWANNKVSSDPRDPIAKRWGREP